MARWVKTKLDDQAFSILADYAKRNGLSIYAATRKLIESGLKYEQGVSRLLNDDEFLLSLITVKLKYDPEFRESLARLLGEEEL